MSRTYGHHVDVLGGLAFLIFPAAILCFLVARLWLPAAMAAIALSALVALTGPGAGAWALMIIGTVGGAMVASELLWHLRDQTLRANPPPLSRLAIRPSIRADAAIAPQAQVLELSGDLCRTDAEARRAGVGQISLDLVIEREPGQDAPTLTLFCNGDPDTEDTVRSEIEGAFHGDVGITRVPQSSHPAGSLFAGVQAHSAGEPELESIER